MSDGGGVQGGSASSGDLVPAVLSGPTTQFVDTRVVWSTVTDDHDRYASGETREAAIENHLRGNRDLKQAVAELKRLGSWEKYSFPVIRGVRKTVTVTTTEVTETYESNDLPADVFGWERDGHE